MSSKIRNEVGQINSEVTNDVGAGEEFSSPAFVCVRNSVHEKHDVLRSPRELHRAVSV